MNGEDALAEAGQENGSSRFIRTFATVFAEREAVEDRLLEARQRIENLEAALLSNRRIGLAIGILMGCRRVSEAEAFAAMREVSQTSHIKIRDLAEQIILTGTL